MQLDENSEDPLTLELTFSPRILFLSLILVTALVITPFLIYVILTGDFFVLLVLTPFWLILGVLIWVLYMNWSIRTKFLITRMRIEIFVDRSRFLEVPFNEVDNIIVFTEKREIPPMRYRIKSTAIGYTLQIKGINMNKTIHLWCFGFGLHNQKKIVAFMTKICTEKNIQISFDNSPKPLIKRNETPCADVAKFREVLKEEKKKKNLEKAVNGGPFF